MDPDESLGSDDFPIDEFSPHDASGRIAHGAMVGSADAQVHFRDDDDGALRTPPLLHVFRHCECLPHQCARRIESARDHEIGVRSRRDHDAPLYFASAARRTSRSAAATYSPSRAMVCVRPSAAPYSLMTRSRSAVDGKSLHQTMRVRPPVSFERHRRAGTGPARRPSRRRGDRRCAAAARSPRR